MSFLGSISGKPDIRKLEKNANIDGLVKALAFPDIEVHLSAAVALGKLGDSRAYEPLAKALRAARSEDRIRSIGALAPLGDVRAVEELIIAMEDPNWKVRIAAAQTLGALVGKISGEQARTQTREVLTDALNTNSRHWSVSDEDKQKLHKASALALAQFGDEGVEPLISSLSSKFVDVRQISARVLATLGKHAVEGLIYSFDSMDWIGRRCAVETLGLIATEPAVDLLAKAMKDTNEEVRIAAEKALTVARSNPSVSPTPLRGEIDQTLKLGRGIEMRFFSSETAVSEYILAQIEELEPVRVLIIGGSVSFAQSLTGQLSDQNGAYEVLWNEHESLQWLCDTAAQVRIDRKRTILISNYPRQTDPPTTQFRDENELVKVVRMPQGTSLALCLDGEQASVAIFLVGMYSMGYCKNVYESQANGYDELATFQVLAWPDCGAFMTLDLNSLEACTDAQECQEQLMEIAGHLENNSQLSPIAYTGGMLVK
jgi:HEAT repeat protein